MGGEHAGDEGAELDVAVVQFCWDGTAELHLDGLEAIIVSEWSRHGDYEETYLYRVVSFPSLPAWVSFVPANLPISGE